MKKLRLNKAISAILTACLLFACTIISTNAAEESTLPSSYSSVDKGYVTGIKSQKRQDCWAYASLSCLETKLLCNGYSAYDMSPDHMNIWATTHSDGTGWLRNVTSAGYSELALGYLMSWQGGVSESTFDELSKTRKFNSDNIPTDLAEYGVTSVRYLDKNDPDTIKSSIMKNGSVFVSFSQSLSCISSDESSYFCPEGYPLGIGHSVSVVGWDDNYSKYNFKAVNGVLPKNDGAWLAKNSNSNLSGFFWISYEDAYLFSSLYEPSYTIESVTPIDDTVRLMQNEIYGSTYKFNYIKDTDEITYINVYNFSDGYNSLDSVIFETESIGADYEIYYVPVQDNAPISDENRWTLLYSDTVPYSGYICADFDDFTLPVSYGAIAVKIDTADTEVQNCIGVGEWLNNDKGEYVFVNDSQYGDSYIYYDGEMTELLDWYSSKRNDDLGGTFVIKAVTRKTQTNVSLMGDVNLDGKFDINDATAVQMHLAYQTELSSTQKLNADYDKNGFIDINDVTAMQMSLAGYEV